VKFPAFFPRSRVYYVCRSVQSARIDDALTMPRPRFISQIVSTLGERYLGKPGFLGISMLGGLVSSASTSAAAPKYCRSRTNAAGAGRRCRRAGVCRESLFNLPIICRNARNPVISRRLAILTIVLSALAIAFLVLEQLKWSFGERGPGICGKARRLSTADLMKQTDSMTRLFIIKRT